MTDEDTIPASTPTERHNQMSKLIHRHLVVGLGNRRGRDFLDDRRAGNDVTVKRPGTVIDDGIDCTGAFEADFTYAAPGVRRAGRSPAAPFRRGQFQET